MKRVLLLLCEGTEILEAAAFYDVLGWSGSVGPERVAVALSLQGDRTGRENADLVRRLMGFGG